MNSSRVLGCRLLTPFLLGLGSSYVLLLNSIGSIEGAIAAEYRGQNIDGQRFSGMIYSHETGGRFNVDVEFKDKTATVYFVNGGKKILKLNSRTIRNPREIHGWSQGIFSIGNVFSIGVAQDTGNREDPYPRPFYGYWTLDVRELEDTVNTPEQAGKL
jgi:hypothetical protein